MNYIGKIWFKKPIKMKKVAEKMGLEDIAVYKTEDMIGTMKWRGADILILIHISWGDMDNVEKIRILAHHLEDTEADEFFRLVMTMFRDIAVEAILSREKIDDMTKREIGRIGSTCVLEV